MKTFTRGTYGGSFSRPRLAAETRASHVSDLGLTLRHEDTSVTAETSNKLACTCLCLRLLDFFSTSAGLMTVKIESQRCWTPVT